MLKENKTSPVLSSLTPAKQAVLAKLLSGELADRPDEDAISPRPVSQDHPPLSFAQERLWFLDQFEPNGVVYNMSTAVRLQGALDVEILERSFNEMVQRHEILRTTFGFHNGQPVQHIALAWDFQLNVEDLRSVEKLEQRIDQLIGEEGKHPFNLAIGPLAQVKVLVVAPQEHVLVVTMHHIVSDAWSMNLFVREITQLYTAFQKGKESPLPPLPIQYADFAVWQRQWLSGSVLEEQLSYWKTQLKGAPTSLSLPVDRPRPALQRFVGSTYRLDISCQWFRQLHALSRREDVTLYVLLLAAFEIVLARYSGQKDFCVGTPVANRTRLETERLIGFFVNTLVIRADVSGDPSVTDLLQSVKNRMISAQTHQDLPFEKLVETLQPERNLSHNPLFQVMFALQTAPSKVDDGLGITVSPLERVRSTAHFDLTLEVIEAGECLTGLFEYSTDLFDEATIERMAHHYHRVLEKMVAQPEAKLSELSLLTDLEHEQIIRTWNATEQDWREGAQSVVELFEAQVARTPEAEAVVFDEQSLTYGELNARVNQLAHSLRTWGVTPEELVGLCVERSLDMVVGLLGILKAGGVYVPLDPAYPTSRLTWMIQDAEVRLLVTQSHLKTQVSEDGVPILCLDSDWSSIGLESSENLGETTVPENGAYLIYTSGSTGTPKGVLIPHGALTNHMRWYQVALPLTPVDRVPQKYSLSFDVGTLEILAPLLAGARLCIMPSSKIFDCQALAQFLLEQGVTVLDVVPAVLRVLLEEPAFMRCCSVRRILCGGEVLPVDAQYRVWEVLGETVELHNLYGPTETTMDSTAWVCQPTSEEPTVPIGRPIANTQVYVLDHTQLPVPIGVWGELHIGGEGLARGYHQNSTLTAARFLPDPFSHDRGARMYTTGDRVRYRSDGSLEYQGRIDEQVKVRGYRIELGEIEAALCTLPEIREAVVGAREAANTEKRLVAYVVGVSEAKLDLDSVKASLCDRLPSYMVPSQWVTLEKLPLLSSGKVDRQALPDPDMYGQLSQEYVAPRTPVEDVLVGIWAEVLRIEQVGIHDNFFERGGDSILSIQVIARARESGLVLTPRQLFQHQTIAELASVATPTSIVEAEQGLVVGAVPLTPIQQWLFEQVLPNPHHYNQAVLFEAMQPLEFESLQTVVTAVLRHHDALRMRFLVEGSTWRLQIEEEIPSEVVLSVDLSTVPETEQQVAIEEQANYWQTSLDLTKGPLMRVVWFDLGPQRPAQLLIVIHHLVVDGVSWRILLEDLQRGYQQAVTGHVVTFPTKTTSWKSWVEQLQVFVRDGGLDDELVYWRDPQWDSVPSLPVDDPCGAATEALGKVVTVSLSAEETRALLQEVPAAYRTQINEVLLTALAQTLGQWADCSAIVVDLEGHGREDLVEGVDVSRTVGWFTSVFPVLLKVLPDSSPGEALKAIKEQIRGIPRRGVGYGLLRYWEASAEVTARLQAHPAPQVCFNYLGQFDQTLSKQALLKEADAGAGSAHDPQGNLAYEMDVNAQVLNDCLVVSWRYSGQRYHCTTMEAISQAYGEALRALIVHCRESEAGGYTPSDFPLARLTQPTLDTVFGSIQGISDIYPLTPMQEGLLFHTLLNPDTGVYVMQDQFTLQGHVNSEIFKRGWDVIVERHPILRTSFVWEELERPLQVVHKTMILPHEELDWRSLDQAEQTASLQQLLEAEQAKGFTMQEVPIMRIRLIRLTEDIYTFILSYHHILLDAWSISPLLMEFLAWYGEARAGKVSSLAPARPFREYLAWIDKQDPKDAETFWRARLEGFSTPTRLLSSQAATSFSDQSDGVAELSIRLSQVSTKALGKVAQQWQLTPNTFVQGAWALVLSTYSNTSDVVFGVTVSGRPPDMPEVESLIGLFINSLPLRVHLPPEQPVVEWLKDLLAQNMTMRHYEYTPLTKIQAWSEVPRGEALFESLFVFENAPMDPFLRAGDLGFGQVRSGRTRTHTNYPVTVVILEGAELSLGISYDRTLFEPATISRMIETFKHILENLIQHPEAKLSELSLLADGEWGQVVETWNTSTQAYPEQDMSIVELFEAQVIRTPEATAVRCGSEQLTYIELNMRANQVAQALRAAGVGPETRVGVLAERGVDLPTMVMGIFKAGGVYMPLDRTYPVARIQQILEVSLLRVMLTTADEEARVGEAIVGLDDAVRPTVLKLDTILNAEESVPNNLTTWYPHQLAYVIYTSGSTGVPKGAMVEHQGLRNHLLSKVTSLELTERDLVGQTASAGFDISVWQLLAALLCGGQVEVVPDEITHDPQQLLAYVEETGMTVLETVPALLRAMLDQEDRPTLSRLRWLLPTGEACPMRVGRVWQEQYPDITLVNAYGPAECADDVAIYPVRGRLPETGGSVPIGRPIGNIQLYVLNQSLMPLPVGGVGELCVGGVGVGRGYLEEPARTGGSFVPNPFGDVPGARLYKTGDLARYQENGTLEFMGRQDHQVKVRGYRIELGEVEVQLRQERAIEDVVVVVREDRSGDKRLVAYGVAVDEMDVGVRVLKEGLRNRLPSYMVPETIVMLDALPRTVNGKVDRKQLPLPEYSELLSSQYVAPQTPTEETMARIWAEVLGVEKVGGHDNFFELGGHSLLGIKLVDHMRQAGLPTSIRALLSTPTVAGLADSLDHSTEQIVIPPNGIPADCDAITPAMLPLIDLTTEHIAHIVKAVSGGARTIQDLYPLAPLQTGILFHHLLDQTGDPYLLGAQVHFNTREGLEQFIEALQAVINRHDILRTAFCWEGLPEPVQVVWRQAFVSFDELSFNEASGGTGEQLRAHYDPSHYRIDVRQAPLIRGGIARDSTTGQWRVQLVWHHLLGDHLTMDILVSEVGLILQGQADRLPVPVPFRNFIVHVQHGTQAVNHNTFFTEMLGDVTEPTVPFGLLNVHEDGFKLEEARRELEPALEQSVRKCARGLGVSVASLLHLAWAQVLARLTGQEDVVFGTVLLGRMHGEEGADRIPGMFMNTLPIRIDTRAQGVAEGIQHAHKLVMRLLEHEHASLPLAQRCSGVADQVPLFTALLNYQHNRRPEPDSQSLLELAWVGIESFEGEKDRTNYPVSMTIADDGDSLALTAQVSMLGQAKRVCAYMHTVLEQLVETVEVAPDTPIRHLEILTANERRQLLVDWNATERDWGEGAQSLVELFEAQVAQQPHAIAVVFDDQEVTYEELNHRANRLAQKLVALGVEPEALVGICVERSVEMLVGLLGVWKAGGAYLPLDPSYPLARLAFILDDAKPAVLVTQLALRCLLSQSEAHVLCLDEEKALSSEKYPEHTNDAVRPHRDRLHTAYLIYTSGSTGVPKGVMITQQSALNFLAAMRACLNSTHHDCLLAVTSLSFDISLLELFLPLTVGARVVLADTETVHDGLRLLEVLDQGHVTMMQATPATWRMLIDVGWAGKSGMQVLSGGEALAPELAGELVKRDVCLWNMYGPTETTVWSSLYHVTDTLQSIPIGHPIANTQLYILDAHMQPVPIGVLGELYIGGDGIARGYWHRPELTAEWFVPNPFSPCGGERLYRTGDVARYRVDGAMECLGRRDHQVKLRGYRIELGEIEAALGALPEIHEAVVMVREDEFGGKRLVGYVVGASEEALDFNTVKIALHDRLPEYMVPSQWVTVDKLPLTANGKVDRQALPAPDVLGQLTQEYVAPRTPTEETLTRIWEEVLGVAQVGVHDNFFELGGHSLLATQVMTRGQQALQVQVSLRTLFECPTIAQLAEAIEAVHGEASSKALLPLVPVPREDPLPLSFAQQRLWVLAQMAPEDPSYNMPVALRLTGQLDVAALEWSINELVQRHEVLRTTFAVHAGEPVQIIRSHQMIPIRVKDVSDLEAAEREEVATRLAIEESERPFNLSTDLFVRFRLLQLRDQEHVLFVTMHHIVSDGWSTAIWVREMTRLYEAACAGTPSPLSPLPIQYADYAVWQQNWLQGRVWDEHVAYWGKQLQGAPAVLHLLQANPRPATPSARGATHSFVISMSVLEKLRALSRQQGVTLFMTLLAAFNVLLARYSGQDDIVIGTDVANRPHPDLEGLIGFFVNLLALRTDMSGNPSFIDLLARVREVTLGAYAHQQLPFEKIVDMLQVPRALDYNPLVQVLFVLQNMPESALEVSGLQFEEFSVNHDTARFDVAMFGHESEDGLLLSCNYSTDLFDASMMQRIGEQYTTLLSSIVAQPTVRLDALEMYMQRDEKVRRVEKPLSKKTSFKQFKQRAPNLRHVSPQTMVSAAPLRADSPLPLVMKPTRPDVDLGEWGQMNREEIEGQLFKHGAILFRGFSVRTVQQFEHMAQAMSPNLFGEYGDLPREGKGDKVYGATPYPADHAILFHNESSHLSRWPLKQYFCCLVAAQEGGSTPIVDGREMYQNLNPVIRKRLEEKQLMYVRHFIPGFDVSWQDFFQTTEQRVVEDYCRQHGIEWTWLEEEALQTRQVCSAIRIHPKTGEHVFFNQIPLHHVSCLQQAVRASLTAMVGEERYPRNVYYGDGSPLEDDVVQAICALYEQYAVRFPWEAGDVLLVDNMLVAHGRDPFVGPRKIIVAMGDMMSRPEPKSVEA